MNKRFRWVFLAVPVGGAIVWLVAAGVGQRGNGDDARFKDGARQTKSSTTRKGELSEYDSDQNEGRESSRHRAGEVEKHRATPLEKKIADQERSMEERKKVLVTMAKARTVNFQGVTDAPPPADTPEEALKKAQAVQDFEDAKREWLADRDVLEKLKQELSDEQAKAK